MKVIRAAIVEFIGMFVDDGSFALALGALIAVVTLAVKYELIAPFSGGLGLLAGCALLLVDSAFRAARRKSAKTD
jgi:hypothetical protein